jgi:hypothetical protein
MCLNFESYTLEAKTPEEVSEWFAHEPHSLRGGLQVLELVFDSEDKANEWLSDNTDQWFGSKAVRANTDEGHVWVVGGLRRT